MSISLVTNVATSVANPSAAAPAVPAPRPASAGSDTVHLSQSAQILQLRHQGQSAAQIGNTLGLTTAVVDADLNITVAKSVAAPAPAGGGGGHPAAPPK